MPRTCAAGVPDGQFVAAEAAVKKFGTTISDVMADVAVRTGGAQKVTAAYARARDAYHATVPVETLPVPHAVLAGSQPAGSGLNFEKAITATVSSLKVFTPPTLGVPLTDVGSSSALLAKLTEIHRALADRPPTTFANQYTINASGTPTKAELDYIAREQAWQLTRSGRR